MERTLIFMDEKFGAAVVAGIAVFGLAFVMNQTGAGGGYQTPQESTESIELYEQNVGKVGASNPDFRHADIGSFSVGETRGDIRGYYKSKATLNDKMFGGKSLSFSYNATTPKEANLTFDVLGRKGKGFVYVKANGEKVFEEQMITDSSPRITVPAEYLNPGMNNFELGVKRSGVFSSSEYVFEDIELRVNDRKFHDYTDNFRLYDYELEDYVDSSLQFDITRSVKTEPLEIFVNDKKVYSKPQVRISPEEVNVNPSNADLRPGNNKIEFRTGDGALYEVGNARFTIRYLGNVDSQNVVLGFDLNSTQREYVDREDTREQIVMDYQNLLPSPRSIRVDLNDYNNTFVPDNGENRLELPEGSLKDLNRLEIKSNGTYKIDSLKIVSEKVENEGQNG